MTQVEQILTELQRNPGMSKADLAQRIEIADGTLRTTLYELRKAGDIRKVGGTGNSYLYGITEQGRKKLEGVAEAPQSRNPELDEVLTLIDRIDEYRLLRRFTSFLLYTRNPEDLQNATDLDVYLKGAALDFLNIDRDEFEQQKKIIETLLSL